MSPSAIPRQVIAEAFTTEPAPGVIRERWLYPIVASDLLSIPTMNGRHVFFSPRGAERFAVYKIQSHGDSRQDVTITTSDGEYLTMPHSTPVWLSTLHDDRGHILLPDPS